MTYDFSSATLQLHYKILTTIAAPVYWVPTLCQACAQCFPFIVSFKSHNSETGAIVI